MSEAVREVTDAAGEAAAEVLSGARLRRVMRVLRRSVGGWCSVHRDGR